MNHQTLAGSLALTFLALLLLGSVPCYAQVRQGSDDLSPEVQAHIRIGQDLLLKERRYAEAIAEFRKAVALAPKSAEAHRMLGVGLFAEAQATGQFAAAIAVFNQAIALDPRRPLTWSNLAGALELSGRRDEAVEAYRKAADLEPRSSSSRRVVGLALVGLKRYDEALVEYRKAAAIAPKDGMPRMYIGRVLAQQGKYEQALTEFRTAAALLPRSSAVLVDLGGAYQQLGKYDEAVVAFRGAVSLAHPTPGLPHYALALALERAGLKPEAEQQLTEAVRLNVRFKDRPEMEWGSNGFAVYRW